MEGKIDLTAEFEGIKTCPTQYVLSIKDTLNILSGKWKLSIIAALLFNVKRFTEIQRTIPEITPRMLSKELKDLELNGIVQRKVHPTTPVLVEYELTESGRSITGLLEKMIEWGLQHRRTVMKNGQ